MPTHAISLRKVTGTRDFTSSFSFPFFFISAYFKGAASISSRGIFMLQKEDGAFIRFYKTVEQKKKKKKFTRHPFFGAAGAGWKMLHFTGVYFTTSRQKGAVKGSPPSSDAMGEGRPSFLPQFYTYTYTHLYTHKWWEPPLPGHPPCKVERKQSLSPSLIWYSYMCIISQSYSLMRTIIPGFIFAFSFKL